MLERLLDIEVTEYDTVTKANCPLYRKEKDYDSY